MKLFSASSLAITLLTLLVAFLAFELESPRWVAVSAAYGIAHATE